MTISFRDVENNPPANLAEWEETIVNDHGLQVKWPKQLRQMYHSHKAKIAIAEKELLSRQTYPGYYLKLSADNGLTLVEAQAQLDDEIITYRWKVSKLKSIIKCCRVELEIRDLLIAAGKHPVEPDDKRESQPDLDIEPLTITTIPARVTRNPIG